MKEHPTTFSAPMVRALLNGTKTQTRRIIGPANAEFGSAPKSYWAHGNLAGAFVDRSASDGERRHDYLHVPCHRGDEKYLVELDEHWRARGVEHSYRESYPDCGPCVECDRMDWRMTSHRLWPRVAPGDTLWVREAWRTGSKLDHLSPKGIAHACVVEASYPKPWAPIHFEADGHRINWNASDFGDVGRYRHARFMPRWASRITLEVTSVRIQRLQEISHEDALADGILEVEKDRTGGWDVREQPLPVSVLAYSHLWESLHGEGSWDENPWVLAYTFKRFWDAR